MRKLRVGVIGLGRMGLIHSQSLIKHINKAKLVACSDIDIERASKCAKEWGISKVTSDPLEVLADPDVDAVVISTPTSTHAELIYQAAVHGKHVFCEKPLATTLNEVNNILKIVAQSEIKLMVGFQRRFDPNFQYAYETIKSERVGKIWLLRITSRDPVPPPLEYIQTSGGLFLDMTIHDFDMARFLVGDEVEEIYAYGSVLVNPQISEVGDVDTAVCVMLFKNGVIGVIDNSRRAVYGYDQRVEVLGSKGMLSVGNPHLHYVTLWTHEGYHGARLMEFFTDRYMEAYVRELESFVEAILAGRDPPISALDCKIAMAMAYAAQKSLLERRPVRLGEIDPSLA